MLFLRSYIDVSGVSPTPPKGREEENYLIQVGLFRGLEQICGIVLFWNFSARFPKKCLPDFLEISTRVNE